ncbi:F-box protein At5g03970-like, partial [Brassica napus]|uniref:F-box protein At5g03970-like n=1 Tax=Brassica napus TaxID=3708 RepID=UPI002079EB71
LRGINYIPQQRNIFVEKLLKENILGDEVETSGALKKLGYYIDSSTGVLLCGRHPKAYYLWDPVTRKQHKIPRHRVHFEEVCMSLITEDCPVEGFSYKVVRGECVSYAAHSNKVRVEIYSSKTTTWGYSELACNEAVSLTPWTAGRVIKGVVYWHTTGGKVAIYDTEDEEKRIDVIKLPKTFNYDEQVLGESSDGCLQYGWSNKSVMEIWKLEKVGEVLEWSIQFKVNFKAMWRLNPVESARFSTRTKETQLLAFFNQNSDSVFIRCDSHICVFDTKTQRVEEVQYQGRGSSFVWDYCKVLPYFQLSWPCSSSSSLLEEGNI